ncbi:MAG TPA: hypothetical protein VGL70_05075 [Candidatus Binatia bacterium]|jgi:uncharacterized membrane protein YeaQ/YmgE (transglycosylase-associated protein family)
MQEIALEAWQYLLDNLLVALVIAFVMGFLAMKTVTHWGKSNIAVYFIVGGLGTFVGQFVVRLVGLKGLLDQVAGMWLLFDMVIAYIGAFIIATIAHLFKPM